MSKDTSVILHIPHNSMHIPEDILPSFLLSSDEFEKEKNRMVDKYTAELFSAEAQIDRVIFPICRLAVDPERFVDNALEEMSKHGMGVLYTRTEDGRQLRKEPTKEEKEALIKSFYAPHQRQLSSLTDDIIQKGKTCIIVDCHSFPSRPFLYERASTLGRPDICIGTDAYHTPKNLSARLVEFFENEGLKVAQNHPYAGSFVPSKFYKTNSDVHSVMIEVNRSLYMNEETGEKNSYFYKIQAMITTILKTL